MSGGDRDALERQLFEAFHQVERPELGVDFHDRLRRRLALEARVRRRNVRARIFATYWALTVLASSVILGSIPWDRNLTSGPLLLATAILGMLYLVPCLLLRRLGWTEMFVGALSGGDGSRP